MKATHLKRTLCMALSASVLLATLSCRKEKAEIPVPVPQSLTAVAGETTLRLSWEAAENAARYELQVKNEEGYSFSDFSEKTEYELTGLTPYTEYSARVRAEGVSDGYTGSEWSQWQTFRTLDKAVADSFDGGDGSENSPYRITRPSHMAFLAKCVNEQTAGYCEYGVHFELASDIDLSAYDPWIPVGSGPADYPYENPEKSFRGILDGKGHKVYNLKVDHTGSEVFTAAGLFGVNNGNISNLNVEGSVKAETSNDAKGNVAAGGIAGFNIIAFEEDGISPKPRSGGIENCTFKGSVSASCGPDLTGTAYAGGICGMVESGNIDDCTATLEEGNTIRATGGNTSMAAGIAGAINGGRIKACSFSGSGSIETLFNSVPEGYYVYAQAGGITGSSIDGSIEGCSVEFSGAFNMPEGGEAVCNLGVISGNCGSSVTDCTAKFDGKATVKTGGAINIGGISGSLAGTGQTSVSLCDATVGGSFTVTQTDKYSEVNFGGIYGNSASATMTVCSSVLSPVLKIDSAADDGISSVNVGGLTGTAGLLTAASYSEWTGDADVKITADITNFGGAVGYSVPADNYKFMIATYAVCNGKVSVEPKGGQTYEANVGGLAGTFSGLNMIWPVQMTLPAYMDGCYAIADAEFSVKDGTAKGIAGKSEDATLNGVFWGSGNSSLEESVAGAAKFASLDKSGFESAIASMNEAIKNSLMASMVSASYTYDSSRNLPVISGN